MAHRGIMSVSRRAGPVRRISQVLLQKYIDNISGKIERMDKDYPEGKYLEV